MKTIQQQLRSNNLSLNEAIDVAQNCPLRRLMFTYGATHVRNERMTQQQKRAQSCCVHTSLQGRRDDQAGTTPQRLTFN